MWQPGDCRTLDLFKIVVSAAALYGRLQTIGATAKLLFGAR
jgi:hypothetical protein